MLKQHLHISLCFTDDKLTDQIYCLFSVTGYPVYIKSF